MLTLFKKIKDIFNSQNNVEIIKIDTENIEIIHETPESDISFLRRMNKKTTTFYDLAKRFHPTSTFSEPLDKDETDYFVNHLCYYTRNYILSEMDTYAKDIDIDISRFHLPKQIIQNDKVKVNSYTKFNYSRFQIDIQIDDVLFRYEVGRHHRTLSILVCVDNDEFSPIELLKRSYIHPKPLIWNDCATEEIKEVIYRTFQEVVQVNERNQMIFTEIEEKKKVQIKEREEVEKQKQLIEKQQKIDLLNQKLGITH